MPGKTRKLSVQQRLIQNIQFLDALLADLQATSTSSATSPSRSESPPPPLPPPPSMEALDVNGKPEEDEFSRQDPASSLTANLSELDSLLEDLSNPLGFGTANESPGTHLF